MGIVLLYICPVAYSLILDIIRCSRWSQQQEALRIQTKYINHNYKLDRGTAVSVFVGNMEVVGSKQGKGERIMKINQATLNLHHLPRQQTKSLKNQNQTVTYLNIPFIGFSN